MLVCMSGGEACIVFSRPHTDSPFDSRFYATPKAETFFTHMLKADGDTTALRLEAFSSTGLFNMLDGNPAAKGALHWLLPVTAMLNVNQTLKTSPHTSACSARRGRSRMQLALPGVRLPLFNAAHWLTSSLADALRAAKKWHIGKRVFWNQYEKKMVQADGFALDNWPLNRPPGG